MKPIVHYFTNQVVEELKTLSDRELNLYLSIVCKSVRLQVNLGKYDLTQPLDEQESYIHKSLQLFCQKGLLIEEIDKYRFGFGAEEGEVVLDWSADRIEKMREELGIRELYLFFQLYARLHNGYTIIDKNERKSIAKGFGMSYPIIDSFQLRETEKSLVKKLYILSYSKRDEFFVYKLLTY